MIVNSFNAEFGYELISVIPYAYYHYLKGDLDGTISAPGSEPLYYFSPNHQIDIEPRSDFGAQMLMSKGYPNVPIHRAKLDTTEFIPPPYRNKYANNIFRWEKPTVVIYNRYNKEWGRPPINFFSLEILTSLFSILKEKYQIVYLGADIPEELQDNSHSMTLGDTDLCKEFPEVLMFQELFKKYGMSWNELQLRIFANCQTFITLNGGGSILASYFGGKNIIFCKESPEIGPKINSFKGWYHFFGGSQIIVAQNEEDLLKEVNNINN